MNHVLSWPHTPILPGLLDGLKAKRHKTVVTPSGMIRFDLPPGPVEMKFCDTTRQLECGAPVYVWWKSGGFVCAATSDVDAEQEMSRGIAARLDEARQRLAEARREKRERVLANVDIVLPLETEISEVAA
jgi:hypothetical protein